MAKLKLKDIESDSRKKSEVEWDLSSGEQSVDGEFIGKATHLAEAILLAEAWAYD